MVIQWIEFNHTSGDRLRSGTNPQLSENEQLKFVWDLYAGDGRFRDFHLYPTDADQGLCILRAHYFSKEWYDIDFEGFLKTWETVKTRNKWGE